MKTIELRELSRKRAKKEIKEYFKKHHGEDFNAADIQEKLRIDIWDVIGILEELEKEGVVKEK